MNIHNHIGLIRVECIALLTAVILVPVILITGLLAKKKALDAAMAIGIFMPALTRVWIIVFARSPGA